MLKNTILKNCTSCSYFSASADGAAYNAAVGSKLVVDNVAIINK